MAILDFVACVFILCLMLASCVSKCPKVKKIKNLRMTYRFQQRLVYFRCKRGFDRIGPKSAVCNGNKWSTDFPICIAPGCLPLEYDKNVLDVTYTYRGSLATFQCKANYVMEDGDNRVYCNKAKWNKAPPTCTKSLSLKKSCDYEDGICGWTQDWRDQFDWEIHSKGTSTKFTGPSHDHTFGTKKEGHYIYIEASAPRRQGDQARLLSPLYNFKKLSVCFEFWYHMWCPSHQSKEVGSLEVFAAPENKSLTSLSPLQTLKGDYGDKWIRERIQIDPMQNSFQIILQATRGANHQNDIGVDDIQLWEGRCDDPQDISNPLPPSTESTSNDTSVIDKETISTTSIQPKIFKSTTNTPVTEIMTDEEIQPTATQSTNKILVTRIRSTTEMKPTEEVATVSQNTMTRSTEAVTENPDNLSNKFTSTQYAESDIRRKNSARSSKKSIDNYTPLAIGVTVALLFGVFVIFFIVWVWARRQDRTRAIADEEEDEDVKPITNAGSICSDQNSFT